MQLVFIKKNNEIQLIMEDIMSLININNLTYAYDGSFENVFENVNIQLDSKWRLGLVGRNGRGKTTLLRILEGELKFQGSITCDKKFKYFPYTVSDKSVLTSQIVDEICTDYEQWEISRELNLLDVSDEILDRPYNSLSQGEQTKVQLVAMFLNKDIYLLIDEPTNHLDITARSTLARYLSKKESFILVSHDRILLDNCVDHILAINKENLELQKGSFSSWWDNKCAQDKSELDKNDKLKKDIKRLEIAAKDKSNWANTAEKGKFGKQESGLKADKGYVGHKAAKQMKTAKILEKRADGAIADKAELLLNIEKTDKLQLSSLPYFKNILLELKNLQIIYDERTICCGVNCTVESGDKVALCGKNGSGKSSIIKLICGEAIDYCGSIDKGSQLVVSYVPQSTAHLSGRLEDYAREYNIDLSLFLALLAKLDFTKTQFARDISTFSEGQKKKVMLARSLCEKAHLYVWDEPLNFIDVFSRIQIEELLLKSTATIIFVEHDKIFNEKIATKTVYLQ